MEKYRTFEDIQEAMVLRLAMHRVHGTDERLNPNKVDGRSKKRMAKEVIDEGYATVETDNGRTYWRPTDKWLEGTASEPKWREAMNAYAVKSLEHDARPSWPPGIKITDMTIEEQRWVALHADELVGIRWEQWCNQHHEVKLPSFDVTTVTSREHLNWWEATLMEARAKRLACANVPRWFEQFHELGAKHLSCALTEADQSHGLRSHGARFLWDDDWLRAVNDAICEWESYLREQNARLVALQELRDKVFVKRLDGPPRWQQERDKLLARCREAVAKGEHEG